MQVHQSLLPYLLIFCSLCSVIAQDTSSQETTTDPDALSFLSYLDKNYFEGPWRSASTAQPFGTFEEHSGFFTSQTLGHCIMPFKVRFTVYDGRYVDGDYFEMSLCHRFSPTFRFDSTNTSFIGTNVSLKVSGNGFTDKSCPSDVSIYFIESSSDSSLFDIQFAISSSDCAFSITTNVLAQIGVFDRDQERFYSVVSSAIVFFELLFFAGIMCIVEKTETKALISPESFYWRWTWALLTIFLNLASHMHRGSSKLFFASFFFIVMQLGISVIQVVLTCTSFDPAVRDNDAKRRGMVLTFCIIITWCIWRYFFNTPWVYFSSCLYLVPQIIKNYKSKIECKLRDFSVLLVLLPSQLFYIGYFWMNSDNFVKLRPNTMFVYTYFGFTAVQVIILFFQSIASKSRYQIQSNEMAHIESADHGDSPEA